MQKKSKHQEYPACLLFVCAATSYSHKGKPFTTIGAKKLNFCVRDGNRCDLLAIVTAHFSRERCSLKTESTKIKGTRKHRLSFHLLKIG